MLRTYTSTRQTLASVPPAASTAALTFSQTWRVCASISPMPAIVPSGRCATMPEMNTSFPVASTAIACAKWPPGFGALSVTDRLSRHRLLPFGQWHLNASNGSRQARQRCSDLHAVEPNSLISSVSALPQVDRPDAPRRTGRGVMRCAPAARCRTRRACDARHRVSQSVVQAGDRPRMERALMPARASAVSISSVIIFIAGQPE